MITVNSITDSQLPTVVLITMRYTVTLILGNGTRDFILSCGALKFYREQAKQWSCLRIQHERKKEKKKKHIVTGATDVTPLINTYVAKRIERLLQINGPLVMLATSN